MLLEIERNRIVSQEFAMDRRNRLLLELELLDRTNPSHFASLAKELLQGSDYAECLNLRLTDNKSGLIIFQNIETHEKKRLIRR